MQKTATKARSSSSYSRPTLQKSTTLSRKYVRKPGAAKRIADVKKVDGTKASVVAKEVANASATIKKSAVAKKAIKVESAEPKVAFKTRAKASELSKAISVSAKKTSMRKEKVERSKSIRRFGKREEAQVARAEKKVGVMRRPMLAKKAEATKRADDKKMKSDAARAAMRGLATMETAKPMKKGHRGRRIALAFACSAIAVAILGVFVAVNMPNISVKVAAIQTGIDAEYPGFVPRNYSMETVSSDKGGKVTMKFVGPNDSSFTLTEEKSSWDSAAVLNNYVKSNYSANYATMHEQGVTYYTDSGSAAWVNGGILYKITSYGKNLTREQIRNLVVSL